MTYQRQYFEGNLLQHEQSVSASQSFEFAWQTKFVFRHIWPPLHVMCPHVISVKQSSSIQGFIMIEKSWTSKEP